MACRWNGSLEGDREILEDLTGKRYEEVLQLAVALDRNEDPLIRHAGADFNVVDQEEAWFFLGRHLNDAHLTALERVALTVFGEDDPQYEEGADAKRLAMFSDRMGKLRYSLSLRQGIADTLCYLGANGAEFNEKGMRDADVAAAVTIRRLFENADSWQSFCSLAPWFTQLAEAAPEQFLTEIETILKERSDKILSLFRDKDDDSFLGSSSPHTFLLWALETLAWSPEYLSRATLAMARIAKVDPGGRLGNRPSGSLIHAFLPWSPSTLASREERKAALSRIGRFEPEVGWTLFKSLLPGVQRTSFYGHEARYRPWGRLWQERLTNGDVWFATDDVTEIVIDAAEAKPGRWIEIIGDVPSFPEDGFRRAISRLSAFSERIVDASELDALYERMRDTLARHRSFPEAEWSMSADRLSAFENAFANFTPSTSSAKWAWVFGERAMFQLGVGADFSQKTKELAELRKTAAEEIYQRDGLAALLKIAEGESNPWIVGDAFGAANVESDNFDVLNASADASPKLLSFALGYIGAKARQLGDQYIWSILGSEWGLLQNANVRARIARIANLNQDTLAQVDGLENETKSAYWSMSGAAGMIIDNAEFISPVIKRLLQHGAVAGAVKTLAFRTYDADPEIDPVLATDVLYQAIAPNAMTMQELSSLQHDIGVILDYLDESPGTDTNKLVQIEFLLASYLSHTRSPKALNKMLAQDPSGFVLLIKAVFRSKKPEVEESEDTSEFPPPKLAYEVLEDIHVLPGQGEDGSIDAVFLLNYVHRARELADQAGRLIICDQRLGQWFSKGPAGTDGIHPHEAVREVFEDLESEHFETGYEVGVANGRGVVTKNLEEGGEQERDLAAKYGGDADQLRAKWPRTAKALRSLSESYSREAKREDQRHQAEN